MKALTPLAIFIAAILLTVAVVQFWLANNSTADIAYPPLLAARTVSSGSIALIAFLLGVSVAAGFWAAIRSLSDKKIAWLRLPNSELEMLQWGSPIALFAILIYAILARGMSPARAGCAELFGAVTIFACTRIFLLIQNGEVFELQNHWGGLGGGLGGWRLSRLAGLSLIAMLFAGATAGVLLIN